MYSWNDKVTKAEISNAARSFAFAYCDGDFHKQNEMFRDLMHEFMHWYNVGSWDGFTDGKFTTLK